MFLVYQPEGSDEPARWRYDPRKLMSAEREKIESLTGKDFSDFTKAVVNGNSRCRRALLFVFLKRDHPTTRFEDVDFAWDELRLEHTRQELELIRGEVSKTLSGDQLAAALEQLDAEIADAPEDDEGGKARLPVAD